MCATFTYVQSLTGHKFELGVYIYDYLCTTNLKGKKKKKYITELAWLPCMHASYLFIQAVAGFDRMTLHEIDQ